MRIIKNIVQYFAKRMTCHHAYKLYAIWREGDQHHEYFFRCSRCGKELKIPLAAKERNWVEDEVEREMQ